MTFGDPPRGGRAKGLSLGLKLAIAIVAVLSIVSSIVFYELTTRASAHLLASKSQAAELVADLFGVTAVAPLDFGDDRDLQTTLENLRVNRQITYAAVWRQGSAEPGATIGQLGPAPLPLVNGVIKPETRMVAESLEIVRPIQRADGTMLGTVLIRFSLASVFAELQAERRAVLLGTAGTAALLALLIVGIARLQIVLPLERLVTAAKRLESGAQPVSVEVASEDEMGRLANAFNTMSAAIVDREQHLASAMERLRELFDNMRQGIVVFGRDGRVHEAPSKQAAVLFGPDVAGRPIQNLLYGDLPEGSPIRQAFDEWVEFAFDVPLDAWAEFAALAPPSAQRKHEGHPQWLELQFIPVAHEGLVARVMMLATDLTGQRQLEQTTHTLEEQHARQIGVMRRLVAGGGQVFASFLESAEARIEAARLQVNGTVTRAALATVFESVHTIRGEARTFDLPELASECQGLERLFREVRDESRTIDRLSPENVATRLERALVAVRAARELFVAASPIGAAVLDQMTVRRSDVERLSEQLGTADEGVRRAIANLSSRPFGECATGVERAAPHWAREVGKEARAVVKGRDVRVPAKIAPVLTAMLPHIVRNAIAHGIETPGARRAAGKPGEGTIELSAVEDGACLVVRVRDDGGGLDEAAIVDQGKRLGLGEAPAAELLFAAGLSTANGTSELAGQGVGMSAVREGLRAIGADIRVGVAARGATGGGAEFVISAPFTLNSRSNILQ